MGRQARRPHPKGRPDYFTLTQGTAAMTTIPYCLVIAWSAACWVGSGDEAAPGRDGNYALAGCNVEGTMWEGKTDFGVFIVRFEPGGVLCYTSGSGTFRNGTWQQHGATILLEMNGHYSDYRGEIRSDHIHGDAINKVGQHWKWDVKRAGPITMENRQTEHSPR
jgi:hypothetical protein